MVDMMTETLVTLDQNGKAPAPARDKWEQASDA